jgi:hypothetical protein
MKNMVGKYFLGRKMMVIVDFALKDNNYIY